MTRIILAFPCMGKTRYAQMHPDKALDLESSHFFFERTGFEELDDEAFKGQEGRMRRPTGVEDYVAAIDKVVQSGIYDYVLISQHPPVAQALMALGYHLTYVKPFDCSESYDVYIQRAIDRGNRPEWAESIMSYISQDPETFYDAAQLSHLSLIKVPPHWYLADVIDAGLI